MLTKTWLVWGDIFYAASFERRPDTVMTFVKVYEVESFDEVGREHTYVSELGGGTDITKANIILEGSVKWDHCSNFKFNGGENYSFHFCSKEQAMRLGILMERIYNKSQHLLSDVWDKV